MRLGYLPAAGINDRDCLASVVDEELVTAHMCLAHRALELGRPAVVLLAEGAVFVGLPLVLLLVLLPQQLQGHAGAAQFTVDVGVVGFEVTRLPRHRWAVQQGLQFFIAQCLGQRPVHVGRARSWLSR